MHKKNQSTCFFPSIFVQRDCLTEAVRVLGGGDLWSKGRIYLCRAESIQLVPMPTCQSRSPKQILVTFSLLATIFFTRLFTPIPPCISPRFPGLHAKFFPSLAKSWFFFGLSHPQTLLPVII